MSNPEVQPLPGSLYRTACTVQMRSGGRTSMKSKTVYSTLVKSSPGTSAQHPGSYLRVYVTPVGQLSDSRVTGAWHAACMTGLPHLYPNLYLHLNLNMRYEVEVPVTTFDEGIQNKGYT